MTGYLPIGNLASEIGCRIIFCCDPTVQPILRGIIRKSGLGIRHEYRDVTDGGDFVLLANKILDDDLLVVVGARANSVSYRAEMAELPGFLQRYFSRNNLMVIFPEQFGESTPLVSFSDPLSSDVATSASPVLQGILSRMRALSRRMNGRGGR